MAQDPNEKLDTDNEEPTQDELDSVLDDQEVGSVPDPYAGDDFDGVQDPALAEEGD